MSIILKIGVGFLSLLLYAVYNTVKPVLSGHSKRRPTIGFLRQIITKCRSKVLQNAPREHSAILSTFIKLPFVFKTFVLPTCIFEWPLKTGFTVNHNDMVYILEVRIIQHLHQ